MRSFNLLMLCLILGVTSLRAQDNKMLLKSWIQQKVVLLKKSPYQDTGYKRFTFEEATCYICFDAGYNQHPQDWSLQGNILKIGIVEYHLDSLTDSTLVITHRGDRQLYFKDEQYLSADTSALVVDTVWNGEPVYKSSRYCMPRYKLGDFSKTMSKAMFANFPDKAGVFRVRFIIGKDGSVNDIQLISGFDDKLNKALLSILQESSGDWTPASCAGKPVQVRTRFTMQFQGETGSKW